jgi:non-ribosomal peptide synthase protein (TIGR01720 family)
VDRVVARLLLQHDTFRLQFSRGDSGLQQTIVQTVETTPFLHLDVSALSEREQLLAIESLIGDVQTSFDLSHAPLFKVVFLDRGTGGPGYLLMVINYQAGDVQSWPIIVADFDIAYRQIAQGKPIVLPSKTTSFKEWAERLHSYANSPGIERELPYWLNETRSQVASLPLDYPGGANVVASSANVTALLKAEETMAIVRLARAYDVRLEDVLLAGLALSFNQWAGDRPVLIDLVCHGREALFEDMDLSRTVGWFSTLFPVALQVADGTAADTLMSVTRQLRAIPNGGVGYGVLRYARNDRALTEELQALPQAQVSFNSLGAPFKDVADITLFNLARFFDGHLYDPLSPRPHLLAVSVLFAGGGQMQVQWTYSQNIHERTTIEGWCQGYVDALRTIVAGCPVELPGRSMEDDER